MIEEKEINSQKNEINCVYNKKENTIKLLYNYDYNQDDSNLSDELKEILNEGKNNLKFIDIYINDKKLEFDTKYTSNEQGHIRVKFIFHKLLTNTSCMFSWCSSLISLDLSSFNTTNVNNMSYMFRCCSSLKSLDLSSFNTTNVNNMKYMFKECVSLKKENVKVSEKGEKILDKFSSCIIF